MFCVSISILLLRMYYLEQNEHKTVYQTQTEWCKFHICHPFRGRRDQWKTGKAGIVGQCFKDKPLRYMEFG